MAKLAVKLGLKPVVILLLMTACLAVAAALFWLEDQSSKQQQVIGQAHQQQLLAMLHQHIEHQLSSWQQQAALLAKLPSVARVMMTNDPQLIDAQQRSLTQFFPNAHTVCLIAAHVDQPDPNACLPISFATLNSIREAKEKDFAPVAMMQLDSEQPYVLVTQAVRNTEGAVLGVLLVSLERSAIDYLIASIQGNTAYIELQQGNKGTTKLLSAGNKQFAQTSSKVIKPIANSHWRLAYWQGESGSVLPYQFIAFALIGLLCVTTLFRELWQGYISKHDVSILKQQLNDLHENKLKTNYTVINRALQAVVDDIKTLSHSGVASTNTEKSSPAKTRPPIIEVAEVDATEIEKEQKKELLPEVKNEKALELSPTIFKAYDIRGIVGETLSASIVRSIGQAIGSLAIDSDYNRLVVGRDGRLSSEELSEALIDGILSTGCDVVDIGLVPTPLVSYASEHLGTHSGVMLTGSHNPIEYNGLKITIGGKSVFGADLQKLYQRILEGNLHTGQGNKTAVDVIDDYIARITSDITINRPISMVIDCGNGASGIVASKLFAALGCDVTELYCDVDGHFPNHHPNPGDPKNLQDLITTVKAQGAELGLAFDGDGDRLGVIDARGEIIWPDRLMMLFAQDVLSRSPTSTIIYDVKSTRLLDDVIKAADGKPVMWKAGHSIIKDKMQELDAPLAGEMSGHIFFKDRWFGFDDALYSASRLLEILAFDPLERTPTEVFASLPNLKNTPEILIEMVEGESQRFMHQLVKDANFSGAKVTTIDGLRVDYPMGWGLVRASNTVPGLTLRFEADTVDNLHHIQQQFKQQMLQVKPTLALHF